MVPGERRGLKVVCYNVGSPSRHMIIDHMVLIPEWSNGNLVGSYPIVAGSSPASGTIWFISILVLCLIVDQEKWVQSPYEPPLSFKVSQAIFKSLSL